MSINIRPAESTDLDAIVNIAMKAFPSDPQWPYRYPYRDTFPEDHLKHTAIFYAEYMRRMREGTNAIMVAETLDPVDPSKPKVIAMSIWDNPLEISPTTGLVGVRPSDNHERRDACPTRLKAYSDATSKTRQELFVARFGCRQLALRQMAALPDYWRRGAASKLLQWGMDRARKEEVAVSMFASPMGRRLYEPFGFKQIGVAHVHVEGEDQGLDVAALAWDPKDEMFEPAMTPSLRCVAQ